MLDQNAIDDAKDVRHHPALRAPVPRVTPVNDHEVPFRHDQSRLILQRRRSTPDEIEEAYATRLDVRAMLDVVWGPVALRCCVVTLVEQRVERVEYESLVGGGRRVLHLVL